MAGSADRSAFFMRRPGAGYFLWRAGSLRRRTVFGFDSLARLVGLGEWHERLRLLVPLPTRSIAHPGWESAPQNGLDPIWHNM